MSVGMIILFIVLFILVIYILSKFFGEQQTLNDFNNANEQVIISADKIPAGDGTNDFTYSLWIYVTDWEVKYGQEKTIFSRSGLETQGIVHSPTVTLGETANTLKVKMSVMPENSGGPNIFECGIKNVPLQRWANITISVSGRALDIYLNGKLVKTCVMNGMPNVKTDAPILLTPFGGFAGYTSQFKYFPSSINPQQAWNIYTKGPGGSILGNLLNQYKLKFVFLKDDREQYSFAI